MIGEIASKLAILERIGHLYINQVSIIGKDGTVYALKKNQEGRTIKYYLSNSEAELDLKND